MLKFLPFKSFASKKYFFEYALVAISSTLLGIWAVKDTIALRNILLGLGVILSLVYLFCACKQEFFKGIRFKNWLPVCLLFLMLLWVVVHYFLFSRYPEVQLQELKSTWLRAFLGAIIGLATGLAVHKRIKLMNLLWLGIGISFFYLIAQYIPRAYASKNIFITDWYGGYYIYIGKINGVLMGTILICGLGSAWIDSLRSEDFVMSFANTFLPLLGMVLALYSYVFIFDTRNGLGISVLLVFGWTLYGCGWFISRGSIKKLTPRFKGIALLAVIALGIFSWFAYQQSRHNAGWMTMVEDSKIAVQIEKYPNWQNTTNYGFPKTEAGREVAGNTYERVAWAVAGIGLIPENPLGIGVLARPFTRLLQEKYPEASPPSTHSAWIEFSLAFGFPGFILMFGTLVTILYLTFLSPNFYFKITVVSLALTIILMYALGELSTQHGVEILFFLMALLAGLRMPLYSETTGLSGAGD